MILNRRDYNLTRGSDDLLLQVNRQQHGFDIKPEITQGMIEIGTAVHSNINAMLEEILAIRALLVSSAQAESGSGRRRLASVPALGRTAHLSQRALPFVSELYGYLAKQFTVYGQHIHIGRRTVTARCG